MQSLNHYSFCTFLSTQFLSLNWFFFLFRNSTLRVVSGFCHFGNTISMSLGVFSLIFHANFWHEQFCWYYIIMFHDPDWFMIMFFHWFWHDKSSLSLDFQIWIKTTYYNKGDVLLHYAHSRSTNPICKHKVRHCIVFFMRISKQLFYRGRFFQRIG